MMKTIRLPAQPSQRPCNLVDRSVNVGEDSMFYSGTVRKDQFWSVSVREGAHDFCSQFVTEHRINIVNTDSI
jgi:hypothetical protein